MSSLTHPLRQFADLAVKVQHSIRNLRSLVEAVNCLVFTVTQKENFCKGSGDGDDMATNRFPGKHSVYGKPDSGQVLGDPECMVRRLVASEK